MYAGAALRIDAAAIAENTRRIAGTDRCDRDGRREGRRVRARDRGARRPGCRGATWLGVTSIAEALPFRWRGVSAPILSWLNPPGSDYDAALLHDIDLAVSSIAQLQQISAAAVRTRRRARIHLHLDTGLARDGIDRTRVDDARRARPPRRARRALRRRRRHEPSGAGRRARRPRDAAAGDAVPQRAAGGTASRAESAARAPGGDGGRDHRSRTRTSGWSGSAPGCTASTPPTRSTCAAR